MRMIVSRSILAAGFVAAAGSASAQQPANPDDVTAGEQIARQDCSGCHSVGHMEGPAENGAPSFYALARQQNQLSIEDALKAPPHGSMPTPSLDPKEIKQVTAYILSLRD